MKCCIDDQKDCICDGADRGNAILIADGVFYLMIIVVVVVGFFR